MPDGNHDMQERQRQIRRSAWWLAALALAFYVGFILLSVRGARG